jgi:regulatory protein
MTLSLKQRALRHLSQREHSRAELLAKLERAERAARLASADNPGPDQGPEKVPESGAGSQVNGPSPEQVVDELAAKGLQSDSRTAEALVAAKARSWGERRLRAALKQRGVPQTLSEAALQPLRGSEFERASAVWQRRFGRAAPVEALTDEDPACRARKHARQARYLAARGFPAEVVTRVLKLASSGELEPAASPD